MCVTHHPYVKITEAISFHLTQTQQFTNLKTEFSCLFQEDVDCPGLVLIAIYPSKSSISNLMDLQVPFIS